MAAVLALGLAVFAAIFLLLSPGAGPSSTGVSPWAGANEAQGQAGPPPPSGEPLLLYTAHSAVLSLGPDPSMQRDPQR